MNAGGRLDTLVMRSADLAGERYMPQKWPRLKPVVETAIRQYVPSLGLVWPWQQEFWDRLKAGFEQPWISDGRIVTGYEGFSEADRKEIPPPALPPAPAVPPGAYSRAPSYDLMEQLQRADQQSWQKWQQQDPFASYPLPDPDQIIVRARNADFLLAAAALGLVALYLVITGAKK